MPQYPYHILIWPIVQDPPQQKHFALRRLVGQKIVNLKPHPFPYALVNVIRQSCHLNNFWEILHNEAQVWVSLRDYHADMSLGATNIDDGAVRWDIGPRVANSEVVRRLSCVRGEGFHGIGEAFGEVGMLGVMCPHCGRRGVGEGVTLKLSMGIT